jgi:hypothetical protein
MRWRRRLQRRQRRALFEVQLRIVTDSLLGIGRSFDAGFVRATAPLRGLGLGFGTPAPIFGLESKRGAAQ